MAGKKYIVEVRDEKHIVTAEIALDGEESGLRLLKLQGDEIYRLEAGGYQKFWLLLKDTKSFLVGESLDICVLCPASLSLAPLIENAQILEADISKETEITIGEAEAYLEMTGRSLKDAMECAGKTLLHLANGDEILAMGIHGSGLKKGTKSVCTKVASSEASVKTSYHKPSKHRPKAFKIEETPVQDPKDMIPVVDVASNREVTAKKTVSPRKSNLPKATATDIQIGIKRITEEQCREVDFRD